LKIKVLLFLLCFLSVGAASAYADPTITVEKVNEYENGGGTKFTDVKVSVRFANSKDSYPTPLYLKRKKHLADGQESLWQELKCYGDWPCGWPPDGVGDVLDTALSEDVVDVEYVLFGPGGVRLAEASFSPGNGTGGGTGGDTGGGTGGGDAGGGGTGGGSDPGDGTGGGDTGGGDTGDGTDPGDGTGGGDTGGGDTGGGCTGCELLACPGWQDIADLFADAIGKEIPPPPDWEEVAETFGDELIPRFEEMLGHPPAPPEIKEPSVPNMDSDIVESLWPTATDSTPPATKPDFGSVPDMQINPDNTGGIDLRNADPTESIPHDPPDYMPIPGQENGGITPQTKPIETPVPSGGGVAQPPPDALPSPGTSAGELPIPGGSTSPPPVPELPPPPP
jgi:hypothetical protein